MQGFILKIGAFYLFLAMGMLARRYCSLELHKRIGMVLVTYALPFVFFASALSIKDLGLVAVAGLSVLMSLSIFAVVVLVKAGGENRVALGTMSAWANNAFIGMPLASILFGDRGLEIATLWSAGSITFFALLTSVVGGSRPTGTGGPAMLLRKLFFPPHVPAFLLGYALNRYGFAPEGLVIEVFGVLKIGIFIVSIAYVGACLELRRDVIEFRLVRSALLFRHLLAPFLLLVILAVDSFVSHLYSAADYKVLFLMATMPIAVNAVILFQERAHLRTQAAFGVTISTLISAMIATVFLVVQLP